MTALSVGRSQVHQLHQAVTAEPRGQLITNVILHVGVKAVGLSLRDPNNQRQESVFLPERTKMHDSNQKSSGYCEGFLGPLTSYWVWGAVYKLPQWGPR